MARKNLLESVMGAQKLDRQNERRSDYALKGASGKMKVSLDALADSAKKLMEGETIINIDPALIDSSFVNDRLSDDLQSYEELKDAIEKDGQNSPILLRPHPEKEGRYMVVFGHRRVRVAREISRPVRAVIKSLDDVAHILAQGQENSARSDLSFIEKALFAKRLTDLGYEKDVIQAALTVDATLLSRLLSVSQKVDERIIDAIGSAKTIGRDRWEAFKKLVMWPEKKAIALEVMESEAFSALSGSTRFEYLFDAVARAGRKTRDPKALKSKAQLWSADRGRIQGRFRQSGKTFHLSLTSDNAVEFGRYLSDNLDGFYKAFSDERG